MTDKQSQTSSQDVVDIKPDHGLDANASADPPELLETGTVKSTPDPEPGASFHQNQPQASSTSRGQVAASSAEKIVVTVAPFTGGPFSVTVNKNDSVEDLKKLVAKKLKVLKDRICLLYRESQLSDGSLEDNHVVNGSRITLLPRAETGLLAQRPEQSVMQALESLNDNQVVDFLSGKAPLNLTMRLGDHMMLIQLQLSTVNSASNSKRARTSTSTSATTSTSSGATTSTSSSATTSRSTGSTISQTEVSSSSTATNATRTSAERSPPPSCSSSGFSTPATSPTNSPPMQEPPSTYRPKLDTRALTEASKNLTQTLKQLSSEVLTTRSDEERPRKRPRTSGASSSSSGGSAGGGAIIESMHHHGKGVYSGTFSGTLNPALQDRNGQPKRDITTIIHILNDLLCAQYKNYSSSSSTSAPSSTQTRGSRATTSSTSTPSSSAASGTTGPSSSSSKANASMANHFGTAPRKSDSTVAGNPTVFAGNVVPPLIVSDERISRMDFEPTISLNRPGPASQDEQTVTRCKMEQLRRIMEERKARRRARREAARAAQYSTSWSVKSSETGAVQTLASSSESGQTSKVSSGSPNSANTNSGTSSNSASASDIFNPELEPVTA